MDVNCLLEVILRFNTVGKMNRRLVITIIICLAIFACGGPETTVTNYVNRDGSVLRKIEMQNSDNNFSEKVLRVPIDSTWIITDSISISGDGDTTWIKFAEKLFENTDAINETYLADSGANMDVSRNATFLRKNRWFTTILCFSERIEKNLLYGYPLEGCLSPEEIEFMSLPRKIMIERLTGADSVKFGELKDSLDIKSEECLIRSVISEWIEEAGKLCESSGNGLLTTAILRSHEDDFNNILELDSGFSSACVAVLGEELAGMFATELDSAESIVYERIDKSFLFDDYTMQIVMPAKVISTNGFTMPGGEIAWPVTGNHFHTSDYLMYAEARIVNYWAIVCSIILCVALLLIVMRRRKQPAQPERREKL
jgi:hypothetical protein